MDEAHVLTIEERKRKEQLEKGMFTADKFINKNYLIGLSSCSIEPLRDIASGAIRMFKVERFIYDKQENVHDKLISVYSGLLNIGSSLLMLLRGDARATTMYLGVRSQSHASTAQEILRKSFQGNFCGSELTALKNQEIERLMNETVDSRIPGATRNVCSVTVIPSTRDEDKDKFVQGIEKFIDTMRGESYSALFLASPVSKSNLELRKRGYEELYSSISPFLKRNISYALNESKSVSRVQADAFSRTINESVCNTTGKNRGENRSTSSGRNSSFSLPGFSWGSSSSNTSGYSTGESWSQAVTKGIAEGKTATISDGITDTKGTTTTFSLEFQNKSLGMLLDKIDRQLKRFEECESFGVWECASYFLADDIQTCVVASNTYQALVSGENTGVENSFLNVWGVENQGLARQVLEYLRHGIHPVFQIQGEGGYESQLVTAGNLISRKELPLMIGIPTKSVSGIHVSSIAEFGRNLYTRTKQVPDRRILLGYIHNMGLTEQSEIALDMDSLTSHCFITGSTGSGKSNTTYCILERLHEKEIPFLVIEPAKGEYKHKFAYLPDLHVFTTNPAQNRLLKINPFRFDESIHVLEHLDRLIEIFNSCWEMYAAMPAILKDAMERMYLNCGWDLLNSIYVGEGPVRYPTFLDLLKVLPQVISSSDYSAETKGNYTGALVTRVRSLTNGIMGNIFCGISDVADEILFDQNCIVDLSRVGSAETKSLLMGILVMKLSEYRMARATGANKSLSHVTVLEEAHNLLKRCGPAQGEGSNVIAKSVEMISNSIAEMRTYGEGFFIVDQSPTAVDISAIKNTNTKIVMRLPEMEDCKAMGNAMGLNQAQILEMTRLGTGIAIVMQNDWLEAVCGKIDEARKTTGAIQRKVSPVAIKEMRGRLILELLNQYLAKNMDEDALVKVIHASPLPQDKQEEFIATARAVVSAMVINRNSKEFSIYLMQIANCKNLFDILDSELSDINFHLVTKDDELKIFGWENIFLKKLDQYLQLNAGKKKILMKYLIYAKILEERSEKYIKIYRILYKS